MQRSIAFVVVFWGKKFRDQFLDYCLASMLAPNNLASFKEPGVEPIDVRIIMCSTQEDYQAVTQTALYRQLLTVADVDFIDIGFPGPDVHKMQHMSLGHKLAIEKLARTKSYGSIITPDILYSDGSLRALARHIRAGTGAVMAPGLRFDLDRVVDQLRDAGVLEPDAPLVIESRPLAKIACASLHSELKRFEYDEPHFCNQPIDAIFKVPDVGMNFHVSGWAIAAADFSRVPNLDVNLLDHETIDAGFVDQNLRFLEPVLLDDSDDFLMVPITTEDDYPLSHMLVPMPCFADRPGEEHLVDERKIAYIRSYLYGPYCDAFKRRAYRTPVRIHYADLPEGVDSAAARSVSIVDRALVTTPPLPRPVYFFVACRDDDMRWFMEKNLAASLMSPLNVPTFTSQQGHRVFIACSARNRQILSEACWMVRLLWDIAPVEFIDIGEPGSAGIERRVLDARKAVATRCLADNAYLSVLEPDLVVSDGAITRVVELVTRGHEAVLALTMPVERKPFEARMGEIGEIAHERLLCLSARRLARNALAFRHPSLRGEAWDGAWGAAGGALTLTHAAPGGMVVQSTAWTVLLADLGAAGLFADGLLPDDFLERALDALHARGHVHHVTDSDELAVVRLLDPTPSHAAPAADAAPWARETAALAHLARALRETGAAPAAGARLEIPVRWHGSDTSPVWDVIADRARALVATAARHAPALLEVPGHADKGAVAARRDRDQVRALQQHRDGDAAIEAFVAAGHMDTLVTRLVRGGALAPSAPPIGDRAALARFGHRLGGVVEAARRFLCHPQAFLLCRQPPTRSGGLPRAGRKRWRRVVAGPQGVAATARLVRAGRLDATVERLAEAGAMPRAWGRGIGPALLRLVPKFHRVKTKAAG